MLRLVVVSLVAAVAVPAAAQTRGFDPSAIYQVPPDGGPTRGPATAPITIVEWSDFSCRYCNRVRTTLEEIDRLYPQQVRWVFRHLPLDEDSPLAAEASLAAAAQGRFWPMHDRLFAVRGQVDRPAVEVLAAELGLDLVRFRGDLDRRAHRAAIARDVAAARQLGVTGTPTIFVNGRPLEGNLPLQSFVRVIDEELVRAAAAAAEGIPEVARAAYLVANGRGHADAEDNLRAPFERLDPMVRYRIGLGLPGHALGPDDALVTIVVWSDLECPYCARQVPVLTKIRREYEGTVRIVFRHLPLDMHPHAALAAEAAVAAAAQGKFWAMHDRIFANQKQLGRAELETHAAAIGLGMAQFRGALDERRYRDAVAADAAAAKMLGVSGTPTLFVNGTPMIGAVSYEDLARSVDAALLAANQMVAAGIDRRDLYAITVGSAAQSERGDPSRMPQSATVGPLELPAAARAQATIGACRLGDEARALRFVERLGGSDKAMAAAVCRLHGIDLK